MWPLTKDVIGLLWNIYDWVSSYHRSEAIVKRDSVKKVISQKFTGKHLFHSSFFNQVADLKPATPFLKKRPWHRWFPVNFAKFLEYLFLKNISVSCFWQMLHMVLNIALLLCMFWKTALEFSQNYCEKLMMKFSSSQV